MHYTIKENSKVRDIQVKTIKYTQQQTWLESLRKQLIDNYRILDIQSFVIAVNEMQRGAYDKARSILLAINQNIEFQSQGSSLYFIIENPSEEEEAYKNCMSLFLAEYGTLIADLLFSLLLIVGLICFIIPGIYLYLRFQFFAQFIVDENAGIIESLKKSWNLTEGHELSLFLLMLAQLLILIIGVVLFLVGLLVAYPLVIMSQCYVYRLLNRQAYVEPNDL